jgi:MscS family membrane protein
MVMLRSLLLYDLAHHPVLVLPGPGEVASQKLKSWTIPESPITLALNQPAMGSKESAAALPCQQCSEQDFLFSPRTVAQVDADFSRLFAEDPALRHRFGGDLYVTWSLLPGGALPPKWILRLPASWKHWLVNQPFGGQSLIQWLILVPSSAMALALGLWPLLHMRHQFRRSLDHLGRRPYWQRVGLLLPLLPLLSLWRWFCIDWVNLTGDRALVVLVTARVLNVAVAMPFVYLFAEAVGQSMIRKRQRSADGTVVLVRRKGAGQLLTIIRVIGLTAAVTVLVQGARSLGLTSVTILALSSVPALAISLGTQQLIRDISDGFSLFLDGQLKVGDQCTIGTPKSGKIDGTVVSMGMRSLSLRLKNGSQLSMPNSQVAESVVTNHSLRSAEPLELRLSLPKLETQALADLQSRAQALLTATKDLASAEAHLDPGDGGWWLLVQGRWSPQLASADLPHRRDGLFLHLHRLVTALEAEGSVSVG